MYCSNCGRKIPDDAKFCSYCGAKGPQKPPEKQKKHIAENKEFFA